MDLVQTLVTFGTGLVSGVILAYAKPLAEDFARARQEKRARRQLALDDLDHALQNWYGNQQLRDRARTLVAQIQDHDLSEHIGKALVAPTDGARNDALGDARHRLGQLKQ